jgi:hypothetical protein
MRDPQWSVVSQDDPPEKRQHAPTQQPASVTAPALRQLQYLGRPARRETEERGAFLGVDHRHFGVKSDESKALNPVHPKIFQVLKS